MNFIINLIKQASSRLGSEALPFIIQESKAVIDFGAGMLEIYFSDMPDDQKQISYKAAGLALKSFLEDLVEQGAILSSEIPGILLSIEGDNIVSIFTK